MRILGVDTATAATVAAVLDTQSGAAWEFRHDPEPGARPAHAAKLLALVERALAASAGDWSSIDRIAVGIGPGGFTGLRIGIATAQGLAKSTGIPVAGVSTLDAITHAALQAATSGPPGRRAVISAIDARRSEIFVTASIPKDDPLASATLYGPAVISPDGLGAVVAGLADTNEPDCAVEAFGDGALRYRETFEQHGIVVPDDADERHRVSGVALCGIAADIPAGDAPADVRPLYLRDPDAVATAGR